MVNIIDTLRRWHKTNAAFAVLGRMDDRMLADIGLVRSDIPGVVRGLK